MTSGFSAEFRWKRGDIGTLRAGIDEWVEQMTARGRSVLLALSHEGKEIMRERIMAATTETGWRRVEEADHAAAGGYTTGDAFPGRYVTGTMYHAVDSDYAFNPSSGEFAASFGWVNEVDDYFIDQEYGLTANGSQIPKMFALHDAFVAIREQMAEDFQHMMESGDVTDWNEVPF